MPHTLYIAIPVLALATVATVAIDRRLSTQLYTDHAGEPEKGRSYLFPDNLPETLAFLPPPPAAGTPQSRRDHNERAAALKFYGTPRYVIAAHDARRDYDPTVSAFTCAFGTGITAARTPRLYKLLANVRLDVRASSYKAKARYRRQPPFELYKSKTCSPADEVLARPSSYPEARAAVGWAFAFILSEVDPDRTEQLNRRAREFARSRLICDAAWNSDLDAGLLLAKQDVVRLNQDNNFRRDLEAAKAEVAIERRANIKPARDCTRETTALAMR
jgi:acid phosphatase (class A)